MLHKMILVGALSVVDYHSPIQTFLAFLVSLVYAMFVLRAAPYDENDLDVLSFATNVALSITFLVGLLMSIDEEHKETIDCQSPQCLTSVLP